jgi:hypothetical protein
MNFPVYDISRRINMKMGLTLKKISKKNIKKGGREKISEKNIQKGRV